MISVIVAGGSGTRLWPLSMPSYPKHLLKLTGKQSLIYYTLERAKTISHSIYVVTDASHAHLVKEQLPSLKDSAFIIEPARRGTASCIVAALDYINKQGHDKNEPISFLAADHYIRDIAGFTHSFKLAETVSKKEEKIVLVGAEPYYPATGFGYIEKDGLVDKQSLVCKVNSFKEKPTFEVAKRYVKSGNYLWNCGYFVGSLNTFLGEMKNNSPELLKNYVALQQTHKSSEYEKIYLGFENNSIDYALIEKVKDLLVVPASFDWMDLGSYSDLHKASESDEKGNHVQGQAVEVEGVEQSFIQNHEDKPVVVIGLDNVVVVNTKDGLLVARKDLAQQVGEVSKRLKKG
ncbi:MAG TPA: sugar phosphate nucleotidyltransferase [Patescibacteria group bacterium]|nr:sugar phosphate nucleotidyltransferase [Patescibacteria group bacterium]